MPNLVTSGWSAGANVSAYPSNALPSTRDGAPAGTALQTVAASAGGVATHTTLVADTPYVLYQASPYRAVRAHISDSATALGRATATGNTTNNSATVSSVSASAGAVIVGQRIAGAGIPNGARVKSVSGNTITMTEKATATATGVALDLAGAKDPKAKVLRDRDGRGTA